MGGKLVDLETTSNKQDLENIILEQKDTIYKLTTIIKELPGSVYWKDKDGVYLGCNSFSKEEMRKIQLIHYDNVIGKTDYDLFSPKTAEQYRQHDLEVIVTGVPIVKEEYVDLPNGEQRVQLSHKKPFRDEQGTIVGIIGNTVDITYLKRIETELINTKENVINMKQSLVWLFNCLHFYFRIPLKEILLLINIIISNETNKSNVALILEIKKFIEILLGDCSNILSFKPLDTTKTPIINKPFDLRVLIKNIIDETSVVAVNKNLKFTLNISENIPKIIIGDEYRIKKILQLILKNAILYTNNDLEIKLDVDFVKRFENKIIIAVIFEDINDLFNKLQKQSIFINEKFNFNFEELLDQYRFNDFESSLLKMLIKDLNGNLKLIKDQKVLRNSCELDFAVNIITNQFQCEEQQPTAMLKFMEVGNFNAAYVNENVMAELYTSIFKDKIYDFNSDNPQPNIIDAGSNLGMAMLFFKNKYPLAKILCFEPDPYNFALLQKNIATNNLKNVVAIKAALAKKTGVIPFYGEAGDASDVRGNSIIPLWGNQRNTSKITTVKAIKLSSYIKNKIDCLKMDIEGAEQQVLEELGEKLKLIKILVMEVHEIQNNYFENNLQTICSILQNYNFDIEVQTIDNLSFLPDTTTNWVKKVNPKLSILKAINKTLQ